MNRVISLTELAELLRWPMMAEALPLVSSGPADTDAGPTAAGNCLLVDLQSRPPPGLDTLPQPPCPVIGVSGSDAAHAGLPNALPDLIDVVAANDEELALLVRGIDDAPEAAAILVQLLRHNARASVADGLFAESLAYSTLQHGAGFRHWLTTRRASPRQEPDTAAPLRVERIGGTLTLTLDRPEKRNAFSAAMRDALCEALQVAMVDDTVREVQLRGAGPAFCAGGDLEEFGLATDAALAHRVRMTRSAAQLLSALSARTRCDLHGACIGAGIELPAFAARLHAHPDSFFQLPELTLGLVPGAGGTVSITRRIGRQRTAWLALTNTRLDAETALRWGLIDALAVISP